MASDSAARPLGHVPDSDEQGSLSSLGIRSLPNNIVTACASDSTHSFVCMNTIYTRILHVVVSTVTVHENPVACPAGPLQLTPPLQLIFDFLRQVF